MCLLGRIEVIEARYVKHPTKHLSQELSECYWITLFVHMNVV